MTYYHVLVSTASASERLTCIAADLSKSQLKRQVVRPYQKGTTIVLGGRLHPPHEFRTICIVKTVNDAELTLDSANYQSRHLFQSEGFDQPAKSGEPSPSGYALEDLPDFGEVVTANFIQGHTGRGTWSTRVFSILKSPIVVGAASILTTVIVTSFSEEIKTLLKALW